MLVMRTGWPRARYMSWCPPEGPPPCCRQVSFANSAAFQTCAQARGESVGTEAGTHGRPGPGYFPLQAIQGEELISALRDYPAPRHLGADTDPDPVQDPDQDPEDEEDSDATPDNRSCLEEGGADLDDEQTDSYRFFSNPSNLR